MSQSKPMSVDKRIAHLEWCVKNWQMAIVDLDRTKRDAQAALAALRGDIPIREIARRSGISAATCSNLLRGWLSASANTISDLIPHMKASLPVTERRDGN